MVRSRHAGSASPQLPPTPACALQVLHFVQPPLCPLHLVEILEGAGCAFAFPTAASPATTGGDSPAVARDPSCIPCSQKDSASWKLHGAATRWDVEMPGKAEVLRLFI